jgi:hypothetical protein
MISYSYDIQGLIKAELDEGIPLERIAVIGYSQGGATALTILFDVSAFVPVNMLYVRLYVSRGSHL